MGESSASKGANLGVPLHGFMDVGYTYSGQPVTDDRHSGFALGNLDFYLTPEISSRVKSLIELVFEWDSQGSLGTDLERLQIGYTFNDSLTGWAGRFHTPYGYWNTAFHHGAQIQTSITRPRFLEFEDKGGILPAHSVGLWGTGKWNVGPGKIVYDAYVVNGDRVVDGELDCQAELDTNSNKGVGGKAGYEFSGALSGLTLGVHGLTQTVNIYTAGTRTGVSKLNVLGLYGVYDTDDWEILTEYYNFHDRNEQGGVGNQKRCASSPGRTSAWRSCSPVCSRLPLHRRPASDRTSSRLARRFSPARPSIGKTATLVLRAHPFFNPMEYPLSRLRSSI